MNSEESIDLSLEGRLSPEDWEALQQELLRDPDLLAKYVEQRWTHAQLLSDRKFLSELAEENHTAAPAQPSSSSGRAKTATSLIGWAVAAAVALFAIVLSLQKPEISPTVATLIETKDCRWEGSGLPTVEGARLSPGSLALAEGMATIRFDSGATVTLEAPTRMEIDSDMRCRLLDGSVVADVPESAHGFTIDTEKLEVIDLGTRFGVTSSEVGGSHVFVFDGEVKVHEEDSKKAKHVFGGKSLHFGPAPGEPDSEINRADPLPSPGRDWIAVSTADGGKDAYLRRGDGSGQTGSHPLLMVKHTDLAASNERRALLGFNLRKLDHSQIAEAKLSLKIEPSGLGFSSLVPDSEFAIYGVLDPAIQNWQESSILWDTMQEFTADEIDPARFERLASFRIPRGSSHSNVEIQSEELTAFLLQPNRNRVTLMIVRESGEWNNQGLVHAFASKEHPSAPAPTLWFKTISDQ